MAPEEAIGFASVSDSTGDLDPADAWFLQDVGADAVGAYAAAA